MLADAKAYSGFAVDDMDRAEEFYGDTLGLRTSMMDEERHLMTLHLAGGRDTLVYVSPTFAPGSYTILNFEVDDIDAAVDGLTARGVELERYEGMEQDEKGISRRGPVHRLVQGPGREHPVAASHADPRSATFRSTLACPMRPVRLLTAASLCSALALACAGAAPAAAPTVGNPGVFGAVVTDMVVRIGGGGAGSVHGVAFSAVRGGTISAGGAVHVPRAGLAFPPVTYTDETYGSGTYTITFVPTSDATGSLNPVTGQGSIHVQFWARLQSQSFDFGPDCGVGSEASPVALTLTTGPTSPPPPTAPIAGSGYDESTGRLTLVNNSVELPATSNCNPPFGDALNSELHLPSAAGRNSVVMDARLEPLIVAQRPPSLTRLRLLPRAFPTRAVGGGGPRPGTRVSYQLSEAATTRFRVERSLPAGGAGAVREAEPRDATPHGVRALGARARELQALRRARGGELPLRGPNRR